MTRHITAATIALLVLGTATVALAGQVPDPRIDRLSRRPAAAAAEASVPATGETAFETRAQLQRILRQYPPNLPSVLRLDPSLLTNQSYLSMYPALQVFVTQHPEVVHNASFFVGDPRDVYRDTRSDTLRVVQGTLAGLGVFLGFALLLGLTGWGVRTLVEHRRWLRLSKIQTDAHSKLLDRLTSNEDLLTYIQSPAGRQFLEAAPFPTAARQPAISAPINRILWSVQAGVILMLAGGGLWYAHRSVIEEVGQVLSVLGVVNMFLGAGFVLSALVAYALSKMLGLFPALHPNA